MNKNIYQNNEKKLPKTYNDDDLFFPKIARQKKIYESIQKNDQKFNDRIVFELIDLELKSRENSGQLIIKDYLTGKINRGECLVKLENYGYNTWWESESLWYIIKINKYSISKNPEDFNLIISECLMEYLSNNNLYNRNKIQSKDAEVTLLFNDNLEVKEFSFTWIRKE
jgi:hypothetical protein